MVIARSTSMEWILIGKAATVLCMVKTCQAKMQNISLILFVPITYIYEQQSSCCKQLLIPALQILYFEHSQIIYDQRVSHYR